MNIGKEYLNLSAYIKAADLPGPVRVTIADCRMEHFDDESKPLLLFDGAQKGLLLNKTNAGVLVAALGEETDLWRGHLVELYPTRVPFGGRMVDAVRLRIPADPPAATDPGNVTTHSGAALLGNPPAGMRPEHAASMAAQAPAPTAQTPEVPARGTAAPADSIPF
jgi:hypothetical protein